MCLHIESIKYTAGNKTRPFHSLFLIYSSRFCIFTEVFRSDDVAACSTALRSATEKNEICVYVTVPYSFKMTV